MKKILLTKNKKTDKSVLVDGGLAQSVEQRNHNPCVEGSNPPPATNKKKRL